jgi:cytochrome c
MKSVVPFMLACLTAVSPAAAQGVTPSAGRTAFQVCAACHGTKPGEKRMGPSLAGIAGRKAGTVAGFAYSEAMATAKFKWDDERLSAYLAKPQQVVPGTRMIFRGVPDPAQRQAIIAYLKSLPAK